MLINQTSSNSIEKNPISNLQENNKESISYNLKHETKKLLAVIALSVAIGNISGCGPEVTQSEIILPIGDEDNDTTGDVIAITESSTEIIEDMTDIGNDEITDKPETDENIIGVDGIVTVDNLNVYTKFSGSEKVDFSTGTENLVEGYSFKFLSPEQQARLIELDQLSLEDFRKLPEDTQLEYCMWVFDNNKPRTEFMFLQFGIDLEYNYNPATPEECVENLTYINTLVANLHTNTSEKGYEYADTVAKKLYPLVRTPNQVKMEENDDNIYIYGYNKKPYLTPYPTTYVKSSSEGQYDNNIVVAFAVEESSEYVNVAPGNEKIMLQFLLNKVTNIQGEEIIISQLHTGLVVNEIPE